MIKFQGTPLDFANQVSKSSVSGFHYSFRVASLIVSLATYFVLFSFLDFMYRRASDINYYGNSGGRKQSMLL